MLYVFLAPLVALSAPQDPVAVRDGVRLHRPPPIRYVESSAGLQAPALDGGPTEIEVGDVNGDGHPDLVSVGDHGSPFVNTQQHGVMVWFGNGTGEWSVFQEGSFGYGGVALGDVNGDGLVDVGYGVHHDYSTTDLGDQILEVALGDGTGRAWTPWDDGLATNGETWGMSATDFADVDGDGDLDVASVSFGCCAGLHVYLNQGDGTWVRSFGFLGGNSSSELLMDDIDNDGNPDVVAGHQSGMVYLGDGARGFANVDTGLVLDPGAPDGFDVGDVNGDGTLELAVVTGTGGIELWRYLSTSSSWEKMAIRGVPRNGPFQAAQLADMNGDGHIDIVAFGRAVGLVMVGDGTGDFVETTAFSTPPPGNVTALRVDGDADHNGRPDIVIVGDEGAWLGLRNTLHFFREASRPRQLAVRVVAPGPNRVLRAGSVRFVEWCSAVPDVAAAATTVSIEISTNGLAGPWTPVASGLPDNGRHQWIVPQVSSGSCRLRLQVTRASGKTVQAISSAFVVR